MTEEAQAVDLAVLMATEFHEIKNQLGQLSLMLGETLVERPDLAQPLNEPRLLCERISERLVQVLTLYKRGQERLTLNIGAHSPADFVEQIRAQAASLAGPRIEVTARTEDAPPFYFFDRYLVELAMLNAVHNALQYARRHIEISAVTDAGGLCFQVRDDSDGYPAHILENQGRMPTQRPGGTGLGLYFARVIAQAHDNRGRHGELRLANKDGATFSLWLP